MNTTLLIPRTCAQRSCRTLATRKQLLKQHQQQLPIRSISSTATRSYAQSTELPSTTTATSSQNQDEASVSSLPNPVPDTTTSTTTTKPKENPSRLPQDQNQPPPSHLFIGTVTRTGTMPSTVQITRQHQVYDPFIQKHYTRPLRLKAHDPNPPTYLREGDVVEYGVYTQNEKDTRAAKDVERIAKEEERLKRTDKSGKALRKFQRDEAMRKLLKGRKRRGVQFVVRRVVTPFGVGLDERMERLGESEGVGQEVSARGGQDSLLRSLGGNLSRSSGRAAVAG